MKNFVLKSTLSLFTFVAVLLGCSKQEVAPQQPEAAVTTQDAVITSYKVKGYLFVRLPGPFNLGHTGVGYEVRKMSGTKVTRTYTYCGGVEGNANFTLHSSGPEKRRLEPIRLYQQRDDAGSHALAVRLHRLQV